MSLKYSDMRFKETRLNLLAIAFLLLGCSGSAEASNEAFYIEPMEIRVRPDGANSSYLEVFNKEAHAAEIHIDVFERTDSLDGSERRVLTKDITVDVTNFKLGAGKTRKLFLQYRGPKKISHERAFRIVVRQVGASQDASLDVRFIYVASMYVTPQSARPKLVVQGIRRTSERELEVELMNEGRAHIVMSDIPAAISQAEEEGLREIQLSADSRRHWARQNLLAGSQRKVILQIGPDEKPVHDGVLSLKLVKPIAHQSKP